MLRPHHSPPMHCNVKETPIPATSIYNTPAAQHQTKGQCVIAGQS